MHIRIDIDEVFLPASLRPSDVRSQLAAAIGEHLALANVPPQIARSLEPHGNLAGMRDGIAAAISTRIESAQPGRGSSIRR